MTIQEFEILVTEALLDIPEELKETLKNIAIVVEDEPSTEQRKSVHLQSHMNLFGLFQGVPLTKRTNALLTFPDKITIFKNPIERAHQTEARIKEQVRQTVLHEIGHYLGLSEKKLRDLGY